LQLTQAEAPVSSWEVPAAQGAQLCAPDAGWLDPAGQLVHLEAPDKEYEPTAHAKHVVLLWAPWN